MTICNSRLGLWVWRDIICIWTTMKTRTPDLLGMSYACANMVHCPGYADDLRQYTTLNSFGQIFRWLLGRDHLVFISAMLPRPVPTTMVDFLERNILGTSSVYCVSSLCTSPPFDEDYLYCCKRLSKEFFFPQPGSLSSNPTHNQLWHSFHALKTFC